MKTSKSFFLRVFLFLKYAINRPNNFLFKNPSILIFHDNLSLHTFVPSFLFSNPPIYFLHILFIFILQKMFNSVVNEKQAKNTSSINYWRIKAFNSASRVYSFIINSFYYFTLARKKQHF